MRRHPLALAFALAFALLAAGCAAPSRAPPFARVAVLGDSISRAVDAGAFGDDPESSWATGTDATDGVLSIVERLELREHANVTGFNDAESGARMRDLALQADAATRQDAQLVLVLMGVNDLCGRGDMTSVDDYRAQFDLAASTLRASHATVYVLSLPDVYALWAREKDDAQARARWSLERACPRLLGDNATDDSRAEVRDREAAFDRVLAEESALYGFATDHGAVAAATFEPEDISRYDAFHPSLAGQARLAAIAWAAGPLV